GPDNRAANGRHPQAGRLRAHNVPQHEPHELIMAMRIEVYEDGSLVDGVEEWWDDVETALASADRDYPILASISPYGDLTLAPSLSAQLAEECHGLAKATTNTKVSELLVKIAALAARAAASGLASLRFNGD